MTGHLSRGLRTAILLSIAIVLVTGGCGHPRSTPEDEIPASDQALITLIGKQITIRGEFSLWGKIGPYVVLDNHHEVYLEHSWGTFTWGPPYSEMDGKVVEATGTLRFYHAPPAVPTDRTVARAFDYFYFEVETTQVRLISGNAKTESKPHRTVKGLPRYMTDIPQPIPPQIKLPDAPETVRDVDCFASFTTASSMQDVVRKCGLPDEQQGSGICIFLYDMDDGSVVVIGTADLKKLMNITQITDRGSHSLL